MKVIPFLNYSEQRVLRIADGVLGAPNYRVFSKPRLADVLKPEVNELSYPEKRFSSQAHFDFVVVDGKSTIPLFALEFDGPYHKDVGQKLRDIRKNRLCSLARFPLLRVTSVHLNEHNKTTLLEFMLRRYELWPAEQKRLMKDIGEYVSTLTQEEFDRLTEGGVADPSIDPHFYFNLENPFPGVARVSDRLFRRFGIVTDCHKISREGALRCHVGIPGRETSPGRMWLVKRGYVLYRPHSVHHHLDVGDGEKLYEGKVQFGMEWGLLTAEDWQTDEVPFDYFRRSRRLPFWFGDPPGIHIPDIVECFSEYLALCRIESWAIGHLEPSRSWAG